LEEISLQELFSILRKWSWLILTLLIVSIALSGIVSIFILKKQYEANTTLMVGKPRDYHGEGNIDYNELVLNQKLVSTYGELIKTRRVTDSVIRNLRLPISNKDFISKVSVSLVKDTEIIKIQVTDEDPKLAARMADETARVFIEAVKDIWKVENVQIIDKAQVPKHHVRPRVKLNIAISAVLGIMIGVFVAFLIEFLDNTIKTSEDVEKYLGIGVIGEIPEYEN